ncbi:MAG TPA: glycine cleavage system protein H [Thermomicrobiaceae bacterium]|nr:glycine cleavage system protein H [Thermomicrobiaceae bacterium]
MSAVNNCNLPDDLYYLVDKHVWVRLEADGEVLIGIDDVAQKLAGKIIVVTPKRAGRTVSKGQSAGTVESSKWVGPVPSPLTGEIVEANEAPQANPGILNSDPYGNWIVRLRPSAWEEEKGELASGPEGIEAYRQLLVAEGIDCGS